MFIKRAEDVGKWKFLIVSGRVDASNAHDFDSTIQNHLSNNTQWVAFELADTSYMNSAGLGVLLATLKTLRTRGGDVAIVRPHDNIKKLFQVSSFCKIFKFYLDAADLPAE